MKAILKQFKSELRRYNILKREIDTLFIGGGTPSCVDFELYEPFFEIVTPFMKKGAEITTEANPNSATEKWLQGMKELGVNRISFGVQSFDMKKLKMLGRNHTPQAASDAVIRAESLGYCDISADLIYGTYLDDKNLLRNDLRRIFDLPVNHISAYSLTIEEKTKFHDTPHIKKDDENLALWLAGEIKNRGFKQYEISNFGTRVCRHNCGYWRYEDYIGIGSGAVGFMKKERFYPHKDITKYIKDPTFTEVENLSDEEIVTEKTLLGLRSDVGVDISIFTPRQLQKIYDLRDEKKIDIKNGRIFNGDFFLSDEIALYILS